MPEDASIPPGPNNDASGEQRGSLWTTAPATVGAPVPTPPSQVSPEELRQIRAAVEATESETKRFEGHASVEAMKRSCA
jgi:hypothetical protein